MPITDFVRHHERHQKRLRKTGRPEVLTVDEGRSMKVFDRAAARLRILDGPRPLTTASGGRMAERYGFGLVP